MPASEAESTNGTGYVLAVRPKPSAPYPDVRKAGGLIYLSGASSRQPGEGAADSGYFVGATMSADGQMRYTSKRDSIW